MYRLTVNEEFTADFQVAQSESPDVRIVTVCATSKGAPAKLTWKLAWDAENIGVHTTFTPNAFQDKRVRPNWGSISDSTAMSGAPLYCCLSYDDENRLTIACADAKNQVRIRAGVSEETARLENTVEIRVGCAVSAYRTEVRIDTRPLPFYRCIEDVAAWWEQHDGYTPAPVPDDARAPLYSSWYSFHQGVDPQRIIEECRYFASLGCKVLIVDDGWQTSDNSRGYAFCGDWEPTPDKVPDMRAFVDAVHRTGLKFMLWYSVPFVGVHTRTYERFRDCMLAPSRHPDTYVLDPRYPEVRAYLIGLYEKAVTAWDLDGFKLDFVDSFQESDVVKPGMDYVSVYDALDRLLKDVMATLRAQKPDILIEFRQSYIGPLMRTFGNMLRSGDCPNDSYQNRQNVLALRLTSRHTAVHSDMVMWNYGEPVEMAAFQLTCVLFAVPQVSVLHDRMPPEHAAMVRNWLSFFVRYRDVLQTGDMFYKNYAANFSYVSSRLGDTQIGAVYSGRIAYLNTRTPRIIVVNATMEDTVLLSSTFGGRYAARIYDCCGNLLSETVCPLGDDPLTVRIPVNGRIELDSI